MAQASALAHAQAWFERLAHALESGRLGQHAELASLFEPQCFWRDMLAFTWTIRTFEGLDAIADMLGACAGQTGARAWRVVEATEGPNDLIEAWFQFETAVGSGRGIVRLRGGRCFILLTTLQSLRGHEEPAGARREQGTVHGVVRGRQSWFERREAERARLGREEQPWCLIVGAGQGGLALGARLRRLGIPTLIIDRLDQPGDTWRRRYRSLCLHDPVWYDHMPYLPFPDHWPVFTPKDKMADWLKAYADIMELNVWCQTACVGASYDEREGRWTVRDDRAGELITLKPAHLVLATGMSGVPRMPQLQGADDFTGTLLHSSQYQGSADWAGKHCVVVGSNNSAHDICADLWEQGAQVTMLQRSPTIVVRSESLQKYAWGPLYSEQALADGVTTERADLLAASWPHRLMPGRLQPVYAQIEQVDADLYEGLRRVGFMVHLGEDRTGIHVAYMRRGSGYYIDVGASQLIMDGRIALRSPAHVSHLEARAVVLQSGERLPADLVVCATGYGSMTGWAEQLISPEVAERLGPCWGLGSGTSGDPGPWEGELRNMWKPTAQPGLWFQGGNLMQARFFSLFLALQLKARYEGLATPVF
jgi:putative flavoprotein involved in K+ transport